MNHPVPEVCEAGWAGTSAGVAGRGKSVVAVGSRKLKIKKVAIRVYDQLNDN
jgi:hypothetical protein